MSKKNIFFFGSMAIYQIVAFLNLLLNFCKMGDIILGWIIVLSLPWWNKWVAKKLDL